MNMVVYGHFVNVNLLQVLGILIHVSIYQSHFNRISCILVVYVKTIFLLYKYVSKIFNFLTYSAYLKLAFYQSKECPFIYCVFTAMPF